MRHRANRCATTVKVVTTAALGLGNLLAPFPEAVAGEDREVNRPAISPAIDDLHLKRRFTRALVRLRDSREAVPIKRLLEADRTGWGGIDLTPVPSEKLTPEAVYRKARQSVVLVGKLHRCARCGKWHTSIASGFVLGASGLLVTSYHVVNDPERETIGVMTADGSVYAVKSVLRSHTESDLAILQVDAEGLAPLVVGEEPPVGSSVHVLSHPDGQLFTFTAGIVSRHFWQHRHGGGDDHENDAGEGLPVSHRVRLMAITADFAKGSSGAPVLDERGAVVGVASRTRSVYTTRDDGTTRKLQMVLKLCTPVEALIELAARRRTMRF